MNILFNRRFVKFNAYKKFCAYKKNDSARFDDQN